jgi:protein-S-isoprenylcysteine O-methyltransferase Ste14
MIETILHTIFSISFLAMFVLRTYYGRKARRNRGNVETRETKLNMTVRAFFGLGYIGALFMYVFAPHLFGWAVIPFPSWLGWIGALITYVSLALLWWVQWALDVQFDTSLHIQSEHKLITHGPYRWVRHPMYTALFLMGFGWFLLTANLAVGIPLMAGIALVVLSRIENEETMLTEIFGDAYREYMKGTGRFIPVFFR